MASPKTDLTLGPTRCLGKYAAVNRPWRKFLKHNILNYLFFTNRDTISFILHKISSMSIIPFILYQWLLWKIKFYNFIITSQFSQLKKNVIAFCGILHVCLIVSHPFVTTLRWWITCSSNISVQCFITLSECLFAPHPRVLLSAADFYADR